MILFLFRVLMETNPYVKMKSTFRAFRMGAQIKKKNYIRQEYLILFVISYFLIQLQRVADERVSTSIKLYHKQMTELFDIDGSYVRPITSNFKLFFLLISCLLLIFFFFIIIILSLCLPYTLINENPKVNKSKKKGITNKIHKILINKLRDLNKKKEIIIMFTVIKIQ